MTTDREPTHPINDHERTCPDCQRVIAEERAAALATPDRADPLPPEGDPTDRADLPSDDRPGDQYES